MERLTNEEENIASQIREILAVEIESDGLVFNAESIKSERITEDAEYKGVRIKFLGTLTTARISMQIDIGFGDIVFPTPQITELPCMLDLPAPSLLCYSRESAIAEKFEAMIKLGQLNSRMKDFHDIWFLSRQFKFELKKLAEAINLTFKKRGTELNEPIEAFSTEFLSSHQQMWIAFCKRLKLEHLPESLQKITIDIKTFLNPIIKNKSENSTWQPGGPWS